MRHRADGGFSLAELLVATLLLLVVTTMLVAVLLPANAAFRAHPEASDLQQRLRTAMTVLHADLAAAGAGFVGGSTPGPLVRRFPPVLPYRLGTVRPDPPSGTFFRSDAITIVTVLSAATQCGTAVGALPDGPVALALGPGCPEAHPACGFEPGMRAVIADDRGSWDAFTVTGIQPAPSRIEHGEDRLAAAYRAGASVAAVRMHTYYWRGDASADLPVLMRYDGYRSDVPVLDHVVGFRLEYFGDPIPPLLDESVPGAPRASYGPAPPPVGVDEGSDTWPAGENCVFAVQAAVHVPRLPTLPADAGTLARLEPAVFTDGPWCPDAGALNRYDADLLRIRRVRVTVRVEASSPAFRGPAGPLFSRPGAARDASALIPDRELSLDVSPRSLQPWR